MRTFLLITLVTLVANITISAQSVRTMCYDYYMVKEESGVVAYKTSAKIILKELENDSIEICIKGAGFNFCDTTSTNAELLEEREKSCIFRYDFNNSALTFYVFYADGHSYVLQVSYTAPDNTTARFYTENYFKHVKSSYEEKGVKIKIARRL